MDRRRAFGALAGIGAALILGGIALAAATQAPSPPATRPPGRDAGPGLLLPGLVPHALLGRMADELALTPEQRQTIQGMFDQARPGFEQLHREMRAGTELLARTAPGDSAYQAVVASVSQQAADAAAQFVLQASQLRAQVHGALTPEQRTRLVTLEAEAATRLQQRRGHDAPPAGANTPSEPQ